MNPQQPSPASADDAPKLRAQLGQLPPARTAQAGLQVPARAPAAQPAARPMISDITPAPSPATALPSVAAPAPVPVQAPVLLPPSQAAPVDRPVPPVYVTPVAPPPVATPPIPTSSVSYQPGLGDSTSSPAKAERIDEKRQQNSSDIEGLITHQHRLKWLKGIASIIAFGAGVLVAVFLINQFIFQSYYVDGTSMTPTLQNDDRLIIDKVERTWAELQGHKYIPQRGQIIVLDSSIVGVSGRQEQLIKRVVGVPGDTVSIKDGIVTIKNQENPDGFDINKKPNINLQPTFAASPIEVTIPEGQVYVMGDNRVENGSYDSRAFGPIESSKIVGRLWARLLPLDKARVF